MFDGRLSLAEGAEAGCGNPQGQSAVAYAVETLLAVFDVEQVVGESSCLQEYVQREAVVFGLA